MYIVSAFLDSELCRYTVVVTKEYIIYITLRMDSTLHRLQLDGLSQPLHSVCSILHYLSVCITADRAGGEK